MPSKGSRPPTALADRIKGLIERSHHGVVARAASDIGIPQPTLARLVAGRVQNPRLDALQALTAYYGVSVDWLLTGEGAEPPAQIGPDGVLAEWRAWLDAVASVGLSDAVREALTVVPLAAYRAWFILTRDFSTTPPTQRVDSAPIGMVHELAVWTTLVREMLANLGPDVARDAITRHVDDVRLGFNGFALYLKGTGQLPSNLANRFGVYLPHAWELEPAASQHDTPAAERRPVRKGKARRSPRR